MKKPGLPVIALLVGLLASAAQAQTVYVEGYSPHYYGPQSYTDLGYYGESSNPQDHIYSRRRVYTTTYRRPVYTRGYTRYSTYDHPAYGRTIYHRTNRGVYVDLFGN